MLLAVCMRSSKPYVLCYDVEKDTLYCLPMMQNLQRSSLQYWILGRAPLLCRTWRPRLLMCPRRMCLSPVASSFFVAAEASPIIMFQVILYRFAICSFLRVIMEPLVTLTCPTIFENLHPWDFKTPSERRFLFLNLERDAGSIRFEAVHQTSSYGRWQCQLFCTRHHYPSG